MNKIAAAVTLAAFLVSLISVAPVAAMRSEQPVNAPVVAAALGRDMGGAVFSYADLENFVNELNPHLQNAIEEATKVRVQGLYPDSAPIEEISPYIPFGCRQAAQTAERLLLARYKDQIEAEVIAGFHDWSIEQPLVGREELASEVLHFALIIKNKAAGERYYLSFFEGQFKIVYTGRPTRLAKNVDTDEIIKVPRHDYLQMYRSGGFDRIHPLLFKIGDDTDILNKGGLRRLSPKQAEEQRIILEKPAVEIDEIISHLPPEFQPAASATGITAGDNQRPIWSLREAMQSINVVSPPQDRIKNAELINFQALGPDANIVTSLIAGNASRFRRSLESRGLPAKPKVIYPFLGRPLALGPLEAAKRHTGITPIAIVGNQAEEVMATLGREVFVYIRQPQVNVYGTGFASNLICSYIPEDYDGFVTVIVGDAPLVDEEVLAALEKGYRDFVDSYEGGEDDVAGMILSGEVENPENTVYGHIIVRKDGSLDGIIESKVIYELIRAAVKGAAGRSAARRLSDYNSFNALKDSKMIYAREELITRIERDPQIQTALDAAGASILIQADRPYIEMPPSMEYSEEAVRLDYLLAQNGLYRISLEGALMTGEDMLFEKRFNPAIYLLRYKIFRQFVGEITNNNPAREHGGNDLFRILNRGGYKVGLVDLDSAKLEGVDTIEKLEELEMRIGGTAGTAGAAGITEADVREGFNDFDTGCEARPGNCIIEEIPWAGINDTFVLTDNPTGRKFVVQKVNPIFSIRALENNIRLHQQAQSEGLPNGWQPLIFYNVKGASRHISAKRWQVMNYVDGKGEVFLSFGDIKRRSDRLDAAESLGTTMVEFRGMLERVPQDSWMPTRQPASAFVNHRYHFRYFDDILKGKIRRLAFASAKNAPYVRLIPGILENPEYAVRIKGLLDDIEQRRHLISSLDGLGTSVEQGDNKISNYIYRYRRNPATQKLECVCMLNLHTIQRGNVLNGLGDALRFAANPSGENPKSLSDVKIDMEIVARVINGYMSKIREYYGADEAERLEPHVYNAAMLYYYELCVRFFTSFLTELTEPDENGSLRQYGTYFRLKARDPEDLYLFKAEVQMLALKEFEAAVAAAIGEKQLMDLLGQLAGNPNPQDISAAMPRIDELIGQLWKPERRRPVRPVIVGAGKGDRFQKSIIAHNAATGENLAVVNKSVAMVDGEPAVKRILDNVLGLVEAQIDILTPIVVVSKDNEAAIRQALERYDVEYVIQDPVCGTGDAVLYAQNKIEDPSAEDMLIIWSTMTVVRPKTLERAVKIHQSVSGSVLIYPAAWREITYAGLNADGAILTDSVETRIEGAKTKGPGLDNIGAFVGRLDEIFPVLRKYRRNNFDADEGEYRGLRGNTVELGFPNTVGPDLAGRHKLPERNKFVIAAHIADARECHGIKTLEDTKTAEAYIAELRAEAASATGYPIDDATVRQRAQEIFEKEILGRPIQREHKEPSNTLTVLVGGGAGFIGSNYVDELLSPEEQQRLLSQHPDKKYIKIIVVDDLSTGTKDNLQQALESDAVVFYEADIRDERAMEQIYREHRPDIVVNFAAQISVPVSMGNHDLDHSINIGGAVSLLRNSIKFGVAKFIPISSAAIFGMPRPEDLRLDENVPYHPLSPYGEHKAEVEVLTELASEHFGLAYTVLRFANVYGPRQTTERGEAAVVPKFLDKISKGESPEILESPDKSDPQAKKGGIRDYIYVKDAVEAVLLATEGRGNNNTFNIGTGVETRAEELFGIIKDITGTEIEPVYEPPRDGDIPSSVFNPGKAERELGFEAKVGLRTGLERTIAWHIAAEGVALVIEPNPQICAEMIQQIEPLGFEYIEMARDENEARAKAEEIRSRGDIIVAVVTSTGSALVENIKDNIGDAKIIVVPEPNRTGEVVRQSL